MTEESAEEAPEEKKEAPAGEESAAPEAETETADAEESAAAAQQPADAKVLQSEAGAAAAAATASFTYGWNTTSGGRRYFLDENGERLTGWWYIDDIPYFFNRSSGLLMTGWLKDGGYWYYLDPSQGGKMVTGFKTIDSQLYYFNSSGHMVTGRWFTLNGNRHYADGYGRIKRGWFKLSGRWYYGIPAKRGAVARSLAVINGKRYLLHPSTGAMTVNGWLQIGKSWYHSNGAGIVQTGWTQVGKDWYYLSPSRHGAMVKSRFVKNKDGWHFVNAYGIMQKNRVIRHSGKLYLLNSWGVMVHGGWYNQNGRRYYADSWGVLKKGIAKVGSRYYLFDPNNAALRRGVWVQIGKSWYHSNSSGAVQTGWTQVGKNWYYLSPGRKGAMVTHRFVKNRDGWHFVNAYGIMQKNRVIKYMGDLYLLNSWGVMQKGGFKKQNGHWYFADEWGVLNTGWLYQGGHWYYFSSGGIMQTGWRRINGDLYYFKGNGQMVTGWVTIGGQRHLFDSDGVYVRSEQKSSSSGSTSGTMQWYMSGTELHFKGGGVFSGDRFAKFATDRGGYYGTGYPWEKYTIDTVVLDSGFTAVKNFYVGMGDGAVPWAMAAGYCDNIVIPSSVTSIEADALDMYETIYGYTGTAAERYANNNGKNFYPLN